MFRHRDLEAVSWPLWTVDFVTNFVTIVAGTDGLRRDRRLANWLILLPWGAL